LNLLCIEPCSKPCRLVGRLPRMLCQGILTLRARPLQLSFGTVDLVLFKLLCSVQVFVPTSLIPPYLTRAERESPTPRLANSGYRGHAGMTRVQRMSCRSEAYEYWRFRNVGNEGVYIVTSPTHYPVNRPGGYTH